MMGTKATRLLLAAGFALTVAPAAGYAVSEVFDHIWLYEEDNGAPFGSRHDGDYTYGWTEDNTANAYNRNAEHVVDDRYDRGIVMAGKSWEVEVENGTYSVLVVAGEPGFVDAVYKIDVEGKPAVDGVPEAAHPFVSGTAAVTVTDGRITISGAPGSRNNRLAYVHITSPLHGVFPGPTYAALPLRIDIGNVGGFPFVDEPGYVRDKMWIDNADYGYYSPTGTMANTYTAQSFGRHDLNAVYSTYLAGTFAYRIRVPVGAYRLTLKFAEFRLGKTGRDNTDIVVNGDTLIHNLDIIAASGGQAQPFDTTVSVNIDKPMIDIGFNYQGSWYSPILNGIELSSASTPAAAHRDGDARFRLSVVPGVIRFGPARRGDKVRVSSLNGRSFVTASLNPGQTSCSIPPLGNGIYMVRLENASGTTTAKSRLVVCH